MMDKTKIRAELAETVANDLKNIEALAPTCFFRRE